MASRFANYASQIANTHDDMKGFVIVSWEAGGAYVFSGEISPDSIVGPTLAPSYVEEIIRREMVGPRIVEENIYRD